MDLKEKLSEFVNGWAKATKEPFTGHPIANLFRQDLKADIENIVKQSFESFEIKASVGAGHWANIPWLSILNPVITSTTQDGIYPVYLFNADGSGFYLSLNQGTTNPTKNLGKKKAEKQADDIKQKLLFQFPELKKWGIQNINLKAETVLGKSYEKPNISAKFYDSSTIPDSDELITDLEELLKIYKDIENFKFDQLVDEVDLANQGVKEPSPIQNTSLSKPFLLLAGISGTGKTRFVREQAELTGSIDETYCLTSVRPDWHEPSDLLGYISRLSQQPHYVATDVLRFIVKAWREIIENIKRDDNGNTVDWHGKELSEVRPFWLCLDEMNLAPVEQYFADYLSILETRCWNDPKKLSNSDLNYIYECDPLIKGSIFTSLDSENDSNQLKPSSLLAKDLGFNLEDDLDKDIWDYFLEHGISIPFNLIVAGTVNMDETTHGFSRKVIDRALTFDFGEFFPNDFDAFFEPKSKPNALTYPTLTDGRNLAELESTFDKDGILSIQFLKTMNTVLDNTPFKLAYRALNELLLSVITQKPTDEIQLQAVWDDFLMCKVLPRIEGDIDKLTKGEATKNILEQLSAELSQVLAKIWDAEVRPDLFQTSVDESSPLTLKCRSKAKLDWMNDQLKNGFTSFWP
jgi:hypothetical protein